MDGMGKIVAYELTKFSWHTRLGLSGCQIAGEKLSQAKASSPAHGATRHEICNEAVAEQKGRDLHQSDRTMTCFRCLGHGRQELNPWTSQWSPLLSMFIAIAFLILRSLTGAVKT
ncbi:hypothetical protein TIFTF001_015090 [Ficus carica]|uniref:Uncharacterized protein n=1 Tax=Ficus carica TaxID=3494 RepID=A0AA88A6J4_FICCA|nr:hypothetical protein TIFTF001_015090 [Ficus carica]